MAIGIYFGGRRLIRPQAATQIDDAGMFARGLGGANTLALIGESTGGEPKKVLWFTDPSYAKSILRSGDLLTAVQRAYDPSAQVSGAYLTAVIRVNPALQAIGTITDAYANPLIILKSVDYGSWNNQIKRRVETGTLSGSKKLTITYGIAYDQGDNIYRKSFALGLSDPLALSGTVSIAYASGIRKLTTVVTASPQKVYFNAAPQTGPYALNLNGTTDHVFIGSDIPFVSATFTLSVVNTLTPRTLTVEYWNGTSWTTVSGLSDLTILTGATFGQNGLVSWTLPSGWQHSLVTTGGPAFDYYWIRISSSAALTGTTAASAIVLGRSGLDITLSDYAYVQQLVDYIESLLGYEADVLTSSPSTERSVDLDDCSSVNLITGLGNTTLTGGYSSGRVLAVAALDNFVVGEFICISRADGTSEETRRVTAKSAVTGAGNLTIDSALANTYSTSDKVRECRELSSDLQAIIDWINAGNTAYITAEFPTDIWSASKVYLAGAVVLPSTANPTRCYVATNNGTSDVTEPSWGTTVGGTTTDNTVIWMCRNLYKSAVANTPDTFLTGGTEGATAQIDWDECLDLLKTEDANLVTCVSYDPAVWASLSTHCSYMSTVGKKERRGFCGGFATADGYTGGKGKWNGSTQIANSIDQMIDYAEQLNTDRMCYVGPGFVAYDENGDKVTYSGAVAAALVAGMAAGVDVAEALTHKTIKVLALEYNPRWADLDRLLEAGVLPLEYDPGHGYRVCQSITTWLRNDKYNRRELSVGRVADYVARQVRERLESDFVGTKGTNTTLISIKNATESVLMQCYRAELLAGNASNPPYKNIQCRLEGDVCYVDFECSPVIPINYIPITIHLTVFTATMTV